MTQAVCFACGDFKFGAFNHCGKCERVPESDEDFVLSLALTDHYFKEDLLREMGKLIKKGERLHLEEDTRARLLEVLSDFKTGPFGSLVMRKQSSPTEDSADTVAAGQSLAQPPEDTDDEETDEIDNETFGAELVDCVRRVAREEISFALRPGVSRCAEQKESTPDHAETFGQELVDLVPRITKQEWTRSEAELQEGGALSLVTDEDCEIFGLELLHVFRCSARDAIAVLINPPLKQETKVASAEQPKAAGSGLSGPKISKAVPVVGFRVGPYQAALFSDIEAVGMIQYEHILVIYEKEQSPLLYVCAEWSRLQPAGEQRLYFLGLFENGSHANLGHDEDIADRNVFALRAIEAARKRLSLPAPSTLDEGEAIAITEILKDLQTKSGVSEARRERYGRVLKRYDAAIAEFLKTFRGETARAAFAQNQVTPRDLLPVGMVMPDAPSGEFDFMKEWQRAALSEAKEIGKIEDRINRADANHNASHSWKKTLQRFFGSSE